MSNFEDLRVRQKINLFFILMVAISGCLYGYNIGSMSGVVLYIQKEIPLTHMEISLFVSSFLWGGVIAILFTSYFTEAFGRRRALLYASIVEYLGISTLILSHSIIPLILGRFIIGIACGVITLTTPLYLVESLPAKVRGRGTAAFQLFLTFGILLSTLVSWSFVRSFAWRSIFMIEFIPATCFFLSVLFIPESPRWLIKKNKPREALAALLRIHSVAESKKIFLALKNHVHVNNENLFHILRHKTYFTPLLLAIGLGMLNQLTGINAFFQYDSTILSLSGFSGHQAALLGSAIITGVNFLTTIIAMLIIDRVERKKFLQYGLIGMLFCLISLTCLNLLMSNSHARAILSTTFLLGFIISFAIAPGAMVWTLRAEILPGKIRSAGLSISLFASTMASALFSSIFLPLQQKIGLSGIFLFCTCMCGVYLFLSELLPKINQHSLEEIEQTLMKKNSEKNNL